MIGDKSGRIATAGHFFIEIFAQFVVLLHRLWYNYNVEKCVFMCEFELCCLGEKRTKA
jgi:hypothetical protein